MENTTNTAEHVIKVMNIFNGYEVAIEIMNYLENNLHFDDEDENREVFYELYDKVIKEAYLKV